MRLLNRIVVLFLVPCLVADPVAVMGSAGAGHCSHPQSEFHSTFTSQALAIPPGYSGPTGTQEPILAAKRAAATSRIDRQDDEGGASNSPAALERQTTTVRTGEFGNPLSTLQIPSVENIEFDTDIAGKVQSELEHDRLYYGLSQAHARWFLEHSINDGIELAEGLTKEEINNNPQGFYVLGRIKHGGPFVIRRQTDALWGWDWDYDSGSYRPLPGQPEDLWRLDKVNGALHDALLALHKTPRELEAKLRADRSKLRIEIRAQHDFRGEHDRDNHTIILHADLLKSRNAMLGVMIDELLHVFNGMEDDLNTAPALQAWAESTAPYKRAGLQGLRDGLATLGTGDSVMDLFDDLYQQIVKMQARLMTQKRPRGMEETAYHEYVSTVIGSFDKRLAEAVADKMLKARGSAPDPYGLSRQTMPTGGESLLQAMRMGRAGGLVLHEENLRHLSASHQKLKPEDLLWLAQQLADGPRRSDRELDRIFYLFYQPWTDMPGDLREEVSARLQLAQHKGFLSPQRCSLFLYTMWTWLSPEERRPDLRLESPSRWKGASPADKLRWIRQAAESIRLDQMKGIVFPKEIAARLGIHVQNVYAIMEDGPLPAMALGLASEKLTPETVRAAAALAKSLPEDILFISDAARMLGCPPSKLKDWAMNYYGQGPSAHLIVHHELLPDFGWADALIQKDPSVEPSPLNSTS